MTEKEAKNRPSIPVILSKWLKLWEKQINNEDLNLNSSNTVIEYNSSPQDNTTPTLPNQVNEPSSE